MINKNINWANIGINLLAFCVFAIVLFDLASYASQPMLSKTYLNPDTDSLTYMAYNVIYEHGSFLAWHIGTSPLFIPELAILFLITLFSKNPFHNLLICAGFQIICIAFLIPFLLKVTTKSTSGLRLGIISVFIFLSTVLFKHATDVYTKYAYIATILSPGFHYGAAILVFTLTLLFLKLNASKFYLKAIFFLLLVLSGMSDPLVYVYFTFPMIATLSILYFFKRLPKKEYFSYISLLIIAFITSFIIYHLLPLHYVQLKLKPSFSPLIVLDYIKTIVFFIQMNFLWGALWLLFMIFAPISIWKALKKNQTSISLVDTMILLQFVTVILSTPLIVLTVSQTLPHSSEIFPKDSLFSNPNMFYKELFYLPYRYFINYFVGPIFLGCPLLLYKHFKGVADKLKNNVIYLTLLIVFAITAFAMKPAHFYKNTFSQFHSDLVVCIDNYAKKYNLTNGISDSYLAANVINNYTRHGHHVALVDSHQFIPVHWQNTQELYQYHNYNFALTNTKIMDKSLRKRFGNPTHLFSCKNAFNHFKLYIYPKGKMNNVFKGRTG